MGAVVRWWRASGRRATFAYEVVDGRVVRAAPYARRWLVGLTETDARMQLAARGFTVERLA